MKKYSNNDETFINDDKMYEDHFEKRGVEKITQNRSKTFKKSALYVPHEVREHVWSRGDKLYKLAHKFYGDKSLWWIIAIWNGKPTEADYNFGTVVEIPLPPDFLVEELS